MYAGEIVERAPVDELFADPQHPYTVGLLGSIPRLDRRAEHAGDHRRHACPNMANPPPGCRFARAARSQSRPASPRRRRSSTSAPGHCVALHRRAPLERLVS